MRTPIGHRRLTRPLAAGLVVLFLIALSVTVALLVMLMRSSTPTPGPGPSPSAPFPRLAMWWPDTESASPAQMARYDWIVLGPWDDPATVARIKALHADEIILNATNACEVSFDPDAPASDDANAELAAVPAQWLLTQCGATLRSAADTDSPVLHVSAVRTTAPDGTDVALFEPGDYVVVDGEVAHVSSVDAEARSLTVKRGVVKAASSHAAKTRVAAAITFWPGSFVMDLTSACPRVSADASTGPETWAEYNARTGAGLLQSAAWDGILVDRSDGDESWLVGDSTARSIDPDRSNRIPAGYSDFDAAWNSGLTGYESRLRELVGDDKIILTNWGYPNYALLNGNNFEGLPSGDPSEYPWSQYVVGPSGDTGSYLQWLARARSPNLTTIETYEDDGGPSSSATSDGSYDNPAEKRGFVPDYRKMRYGLTSALLGDGYFSYEINTDGHGSLGLLWFDEYDGAGRGRGWLGTPESSTTCVGMSRLGRNLLDGAGGFDTKQELDSWELSTESPAVARISLDAAEKHSGASSARTHIRTSDGTDWHVSAAHDVAVTKGTDYTLRFWARSDTTHTVNAWVEKAADPWSDEVDFGGVDVTPSWREYVLTAPSDASDPAARLVLALGTSAGDVWFDDVRLSAGDPNVWMRRFSGGMSIVNATDSPATVPLGGLYRRLLGTQAPIVNDGRLATSVTVPARDGIVLAKPSGGGPSARIRHATSLATR